ncbi:hypothetical protein CNMCM5793_009200 [Aspergillus hiratsukae]|uniref:Uncharacterized protein n=1 Tax=Aspergillus hiratsukae TaxID=1194566 RepID=A0A8H6P1Y7_9EURO|nr:hypothetical protein CNMCM5793_009200 [Aspergillus hiratsukae]KAF7155673.1 hypothetical protein CNMCM6106_005955 [Aspergillus hiratsukae]
MPNEVHNCSNSWVIQQFGLSYKSGFLSDLEYASPGDGYLEALQADSAEIYFDRSCSSHTKTGRDRDGALYFPACNDDVDLLEFLVKVAARFPTHEVEALKVILEGCGGNASEAIAEIESLCITIFDESMTLCEEDVQDHDEESGCIVKEDMAGQSDQSDANTEDQAAMMRDEEVYDSD